MGPSRGVDAVLMMSRRKEHEVQGFMLKVVNNHCAELEAYIEGPRLEGRVRLTIVVLIIPLVRKKLAIEKMFPAVTKEFSTNGLSVVLNPARTLDEVVLGFRWDSEMRYVRAKAKHTSPMGAGYFQMGFRVVEVLNGGDYPELEELRF
jgi:uncharacterized protein YqgV (UPF0045/DUF77 family)